MKLILERADVLGALSRVTGVVARNSNVPILSNVLLIAAENTLTIRATDLDMQAVTSCPADISDAGEITVDAGRLAEIVKSAANGSQISLELPDDDPRMLVKSGRSRFRLPVLAPDAFPKIPDDKWAATFEMPSEVLSDMLSRASVSVSQDASRPMLGGVYLHVVGSELVAVATSGFRMTRVSTGLPEKAAKTPGVILPMKTVSQVIRLLDGGVSVVVSASKEKVRFEVGGAVITSKVIDYPYVDYQRVIPADLPLVAQISKEPFASAIRRAAIAGDVDQHGSGVKLTLTTGLMSITGRNAESEASDEIEVDYDGREIVVGVTSGPLLDALAGLDGDTVSLNMVDEKTPVTLTSPTDPDALQLLVQRRVA